MNIKTKDKIFNIFYKLLTKYTVLTFAVFTLLFTLLLIPRGMSIQMPLSWGLFLTALFGLFFHVASHAQGNTKEIYKSDRELKIVVRGNIYGGIIILCVSIWLYVDFLNRDIEYEKIESYNMESPSDVTNAYIFNINDTKGCNMYVNENLITVDKNNPIGVYHVTVDDMFGVNYLDYYSVKSDLMDDYVKLSILD